MIHRNGAAIFIALLASAASTEARADDQVCNDGYEQGQVLRKDTKLLEAREKFRACVNTCMLEAKKKACGDWLSQTEHDIPTVVLSAKDVSGAILVDVTVAMDGKPMVTKLDGRSVEVNPGLHTFSFQSPDGTNKKEIQFVAEQGKKDTPAAVTLGETPPPKPDLNPPPANPAGGPVATPVGQALTTPDTPPIQSGSPAPWKTIGLVTAGVGVVGLGIGTVFGLQASSKKNDAGCDSNSVCPNQGAASTLAQAANDGNLSTAFFVIGAVLTAGGITIWALAPSAPVQVAPSVGQNDVGMTLSGTW
jgi:hypothetical protein